MSYLICRQAVRRGIPLELRGEFWCVLCNVDGRKALKSTSEASAGKSLYAKLVQEASNRGSLFQLSFRATQVRCETLWFR